MRILFAIPHYVRPAGAAGSPDRIHGALLAGADPRVEALTACLSALHGLFAPGRCLIDHGRRIARVAPAAGVAQALDVVLCTTRGHHVLGRLSATPRCCSHRETDAVPELLGFACHDVLRERLGQYDYYCYLEDDLVLHDPWFFLKLAWFNGAVGDDKALLPNRFETGLNYPVPKVYVDGDLGEHCTAPFQDLNDAPAQTLELMGQRVVFARTRNPHSGCFFLNARQMAHWVRQPHFADRQSRFIGPLETAASLGVMRTFKVYKPAPPHADFLEVQHHGTGYLAQLRLPDRPNQGPSFSVFPQV
jgi:hypothetical protein